MIRASHPPAETKSFGCPRVRDGTVKVRKPTVVKSVGSGRRFMWSAERFYGALCSSGGGSPALRFRKRVIRSQRKMSNTLPALTKPDMRAAVLSIRWEDISKLRVPRLIVGYIFSTTTVSVAAAAVTITAIAMMAMSRIIGRMSDGIASFACCMQKRRKGD